VAPASFFLPLWSAHAAMKRKKEALLQEVSAQFNLDFDLALANLSKDAETIGQELKKIQSLQDMQQLINETFPTWPFNSRTLQRFSFSTALPVVTSLGSVVDIRS
jgi:hypothetical protein